MLQNPTAASLVRHVAYKTWAQGRLARKNRPARPLQRHFREKFAQQA